jgi:hypothetical protein
MARWLRVLVLYIGMVGVLFVPRAVAQETLAVEIAKKATLVDGGQAVELQVTVTCPAGVEVLEAFLYVTQDGNQTLFTSFQPTCDGTPHMLLVRPQPGRRSRRPRSSSCAAERHHSVRRTTPHPIRYRVLLTFLWAACWSGLSSRGRSWR